MKGKDLTTIKTGGELKDLHKPKTTSELIELLKKIESYKILGFGSNLLISDDGVSEPVVSFVGKEIVVEGTVVTVDAGFGLMSLARKTSEIGLSGLEFAGGIPGSVGGACFMNAGAHGAEIGDVLSRVWFVTKEGREESLSREELSMSYRHSGINGFITKAEFSLVRSSNSKELLIKNLEYRKATQPLHLPSFGSVFRNPKNRKAGEIIESLGLKGFKVGGAKVSDLHANWIVNPNKNATSEDVRELIKIIKNRAKIEANCDLEPEVVMWF
jgi:UDP-N-acetylmuramate dehydrogenase